MKVKYFNNSQIAKMLRSVAAAYTIKGENNFKIIAYDRAADSVEKATSELKDLWEEGNLKTVPGLGASIIGHLNELFSKGKVTHFEEVKKGIPSSVFEFLEIPGMGPKTAYTLATKLHLKNTSDLERAAKKGKIRALSGFGEKSEKEILTSLKQLQAKSRRYLLPFAFPVAERYISYLKDSREAKTVLPLGSLRRMVSTVGDIDLAVSSSNAPKVIERFKEYKEVSRVLTSGTIASSVVLKSGIQVDVKVLPQESFGALLQHFTGSKNHNISLREYALKRGMSLSEYGIKFEGKSYKFQTEEAFYKFLGLDYIEPELRENTGEIEAALTHTLPELVDLQQIKGDIHLHSDYQIEPSHDLGLNSFDEIIKKAKSLNYEYVGLSDHSPGYFTHTKSQITDLIKKRKEAIEQLKSSQRNIGILNLLEIDILANGELSVPNEGLDLLDGVIAGVHSSHNQDKKSITQRILNACKSPHVKVIAHPTNRLLGSRESSDCDWDKVFEACKKTKTILEINAWPNRLDLPDTLVKEALKAGVKLIINTDSHAAEQMDNMRFGVSVARRGWATRSDIVNTRPWVEFRKIFEL